MSQFVLVFPYSHLHVQTCQHFTNQIIIFTFLHPSVDLYRFIVWSECSGKQITDSVVFQVLSLLIWLLTPTEAPPQSNLSLIGARTRREVDCRDQQEYRIEGICCLKCPAGDSPGAKPPSVWPATVWSGLVCALGTYVTSPCRTSGQRGVCRECDDGTYMEHANGLKQCFRCAQCRSGNPGSPAAYSAFPNLAERNLHPQKLVLFSQMRKCWSHARTPTTQSVAAGWAAFVIRTRRASCARSVPGNGADTLATFKTHGSSLKPLFSSALPQVWPGWGDGEELHPHSKHRVQEGPAQFCPSHRYWDQQKCHFHTPLTRAPILTTVVRSTSGGRGMCERCSRIPGYSNTDLFLPHSWRIVLVSSQLASPWSCCCRWPLSLSSSSPSLDVSGTAGKEPVSLIPKTSPLAFT